MIKTNLQVGKLHDLDHKNVWNNKHVKYCVAQKFLRVIFAIFPAIHKNKFPHIKITTNIFPKNWHQSKYSLT